LPDIGWLTPDGEEMEDEHWDSYGSVSLQVFLNGHGIATPDERGEQIVDDTFLIVFHAHSEDRVIQLPRAKWGTSWSRVMDTERGFAPDSRERYGAGAQLAVVARSLWVLRRE
jgi:glycogen operon protein